MQRSKDPKHLTPANGHPENRVSIYKTRQLTWSIAQGIRQVTSFLSPKMKGNEDEKEGTA